MSGKVLRSGKLLDRLSDLLNEHTHVDIATAWATGGEHLRVLADAANRGSGGVKVRALVGIRGNATSPDALEELSRIADGDLRIVESDRLFHPKLYLFERRADGGVRRQAWIGSANFTQAGFGGRANEEIVLEVGSGASADALADWFQERWEECPTRKPVSEVIRDYAEKRKQDPPESFLRDIVSGPVFGRRDLLDDAHRPQTLAEYRQALVRCEKIPPKGAMAWQILDPEGDSHMRVIAQRRELLLGDTGWSALDKRPRKKLKGSYFKPESQFWGTLGRMTRTNWTAVRDNEDEIRAVLKEIVNAPEASFPDIAVEAMHRLDEIRFVGPATQTLLLSLARPDRLLPLATTSQDALGALSGKAPTSLGKPENYRELLLWLYSQPWYTDGPPADKRLELIWRFRAALVDAFVYEPLK